MQKIMSARAMRCQKQIKDEKHPLTPIKAAHNYDLFCPLEVQDETETAPEPEKLNVVRTNIPTDRVRSNPWFNEEDFNLSRALNQAGSKERAKVAETNIVKTRTKAQFGARIYFLRRAGQLQEIDGRYIIHPAGHAQLPDVPN
eukprot:GHVT01074977.1.p1 GENE.GHVT01074977.1~~GHVT01074977.1.p1  ORF type:complete len:143 (-),score=7.07 GHVT01074977.1:1241-1669(-)